MWRTPITTRLGLELPFVSAGMGFLALPALAAAVSEAGGLGLLGAAPCSSGTLEAWLEQTRRLTTRPFGVDFVVDETAFGPATTEDHIDVVVDHRVPVVVFFWHLPPERWVERLKAAGSQVWMQVGSVAAARQAVAEGADVVIIQGAEAGGHNRSDLGTLTAVPATVDAVAPVPVIAAGGIADGRGVAAALALGADAVLVGTRLVASREANAHAGYKERVVAAGPDGTVRTSLFGIEWPDQPMNVLRNPLVDAWKGRDDKTPQGAPPVLIGHSRLEGRPYPMPRFSALLPTPETEGDLDQMCLAAGQSAALTGEMLPAAQIVRGMMDEAAQILRSRLRALVERNPAPSSPGGRGGTRAAPTPADPGVS